MTFTSLAVFLRYMELVLLVIDSPEWEYAWNWVAEHPINNGLEEPSVALNNGQTWEYMGSYKQGSRVIHSFRHRMHPVTHKVEELNLMASPDFGPEQIQKKFKL